MKRIKTKYPGVFYIMGRAVSTGKAEKIFYIRYYKDGKEVEEKAGRQFQDDMSAARAYSRRAQRIEGKEPSNRAKRLDEKKKRKTRGPLNNSRYKRAFLPGSLLSGNIRSTTCL